MKIFGGILVALWAIAALGFYLQNWVFDKNQSSVYGMEWAVKWAVIVLVLVILSIIWLVLHYIYHR